MINKEKPRSNVPVVSSSTAFFDIYDDVVDDQQNTIDLSTETQKEREENLNKENAEDLSETSNLAQIGAAAATSVIGNPAVAATSDSSQPRKQQTKQEIIKETKQMSTKNMIQELQDMYDANFLPKELAQEFKRIREEDMPNAYKDKDDEYAQEIVKRVRTIREAAKLYENNLKQFKHSKASSKERANTPSPSKVPPGEEFGATPQRNVNVELLSHQQRADKMTLGTMTRFMNDAYENDQLNKVQTKTLKNILKQSKTLDKNNKEGQSDQEKIIRQEYAMFLSYKKDTIKTSDPSRGRSVTRGEKSLESTRSKSRAKSEPSGYEGYHV